MTRWHFRLRAPASTSIDASGLRRARLAEWSADQVRSTTLVADGNRVPVGELFELRIESSAVDELCFEGDLACVHAIGAFHDLGVIRILGDAGSHVGASMTGGTVTVEGNVADFVGGAAGAGKTGMSGGEIRVRGDAGAYAGHRMRRGAILIRGSAGSLTAASMVAGTIAVGGALGQDSCVGMKRGTLLLPGQREDVFRETRFSAPNPFVAGFLRLYRESQYHEFIEPLAANSLCRVRADLDVGGLGEILFPG